LLGNKGRKTVSAFLKLSVSSIILWLLVKHITPGGIIAAFTASNPLLLIPAFGISLLVLLIQVTKWYILVRAVDEKINYASALSSYLKGGIAGALTPGQLGEVSRVFFIKGSDWRQLTGVHVMDKIYNLLALYLLASIGLAWFYSKWFLVLLAAIPGLTYLGLVHFHRLENRLSRSPGGTKGKSTLAEMANGLTSITPALSARGLALALVSQLLILLEYFILVRAFNPSVSPEIMIATAMVLAITTIPVSISGLGVREATAVLIFRRFAVSPAQAVNASLSLFFLNIVLRALAGLAIMVCEGHVTLRGEKPSAKSLRAD